MSESAGDVVCGSESVGFGNGEAGAGDGGHDTETLGEAAGEGGLASADVAEELDDKGSVGKIVGRT